MKMYDYINRVVITLPLSGLRGYVDNTLPSRCYAITMILRVRRIFFEITAFPNSKGLIWIHMSNVVVRFTLILLL